MNSTQYVGGWQRLRLKFITRLAYGDSLPSELRREGSVPVFGSNGIVGTHDCPNTRGPVILVGRKGSFGKIQWSEQAAFGIDTTYFIDSRHSRASLRWLYYALQTLNLDAVSQDTGVPGLSREVAYESILAVPPAEAQAKIAAFLDRNTAAIDELISKKEQAATLLAEQRQTILTRAVTTGLDSDVPTRLSDVATLGRTPLHWDTVRLKHVVARIVDCPHSTPEYEDDGDCIVVRTSDVDRGRLDLERARRCSWATYWERTARMAPAFGDILYSREGERFGMAALVPDRVPICLGQRMMIFRVGARVDPMFLMWFLNSASAYAQVVQDTVGATSPRVNIPTVANIWIPLPPLDAQRAIASFVSTEVGRIDAIRDRIDASIHTLNQYRQSLITAAVTGKIDVTREEAA
ncbi:restriction endonuclease subunit S [Polyangium sp. 15x6]|uniref:restriction endonuclease subunit S n=1 Tax=Polyangium sp. 15x6 TaxID=3042687 RepID=UPI00249B949E|nr:restriction endonuclease subunit S [Polyangium sp. 15x6]MDI3285044.1 restriction endonuclease subunit S [Polyangium sp. 15x6]